jgi:hypothetical protein
VTNPFQAAAAQASQSAPAASAPVRNAMPIDASNPFAQSSELGGGGGTFAPTPSVENLVGRTVVYIPRTFDANALVPASFGAPAGATRKQWTADLYILDGGELRFWYTKKGDPKATPPTQDATVEHVVENVTPEDPYVCLNTWVAQAAFVGKLSAAADRGQILIGSPIRGAMKAQREKGMTDEQVQADFDAWLARGKPGNFQFVWLLADVTPDGMKNVQTWWATHKDSIKL